MNKFEERLSKNNLSFEMLKFDDSTHTALDAAKNLGCDVKYIGKSILFKDKSSDEAYLFITSGINRVNLDSVNKILGVNLEKASPEFVLQKTGYNIGGVTPFFHDHDVKIYLDSDLKDFEFIYCAGGDANTVFKITVSELKNLTKANFIELK